MTDQQHPITPPPQLVEQWYDAIDNSSTSWKQELATQAAQWGADVELEACCEWLDFYAAASEARDLRAARRPKLKSLAVKALEAQSRMWAGSSTHDDWGLVRAALERLRELENGND